MKVPAPTATIVTTKMVPVRRPYVRNNDGASSGTRAGPDGNATMFWPSATRLIPRRTIAVACAVRQAVNAMIASARADVMPPASGQRSCNPAAAATSNPIPRPSAVTTPRVVGRRWVLTRSSPLPAP